MASGDADMEVVVDEKEKARLDEMHEKLEQGKAFHLANKPEQAEAAYKSVMAQEGDGEEFNKLKEQAICKLGELYADNNRVKDIQELMVGIRPFFSNIPKAKTAKIVRTLIELVAKVPGSTELQTQLCVETIEWCKQEKRSFLRHRIQAKLAAMYFETRDFTRAMALTEELLKEVKKLDDKVSCVCMCTCVRMCVRDCIYIYTHTYTHTHTHTHTPGTRAPAPPPRGSGALPFTLEKVVRAHLRSSVWIPKRTNHMSVSLK
jgi:hypothetical protein